MVQKVFDMEYSLLNLSGFVSLILIGTSRRRKEYKDHKARYLSW